MDAKEINRIKETLDILEAGFVSRGTSLFRKLLKPEIQPYIEDILRTKDFEKFEMPGRKRYLILFKRYIQECFVQGMNLADMELQAKRAQFDDQQQKPAEIIPTDALNWIDSWTEYFGEEYYGDVTQDVVRVLKSGLAEGWAVKKTIDNLNQYLTGPAYNQRRLEVIARTNSTTAFNQGRLEMFRQAGDFVEYVQFMAILDSRTTDICESRNGKLMRLDDPELAANTPPLHYNCRSILSPMSRYDLADMEKAGWKDAEGRTMEQLLDWKDVATPAKGFEKNMGNNVPQMPRGGAGGSKPPITVGTGGGGPMGPSNYIRKAKDQISKGINTPKDIIEVGKFLKSEIDSRVSLLRDELSVTKKEQEKFSNEVDKWFQKNLVITKLSEDISNKLDKVLELSSKQAEIKTRIHKSYKDISLEVLKEIRPFGNPGKQNFDVKIKKEIKQKLEKAEQYYPADWWDKTNSIILHASSRQKRAFYRIIEREVNIRKTSPERTIIHEYGHRFEAEINEVGRMAQEYLLYRTKNGTNPRELLRKSTGSKIYRKDEITFTNSGFASDYMAKIYEKTKGKLDFECTEILSMGIQGLFLNNPDMWGTDLESVEFILGVLASL